MPRGSAARLAQQVLALLDESAVDPREPSRMWLITRLPEGEKIMVGEVHPLSRLMHTRAGLAYLTPPDRELLGIGFYTADLLLPSPDEVEARCAQELAAPELSRSQRWRWQRIARQLPGARERPTKWAGFAFDNNLAERQRELVGVALSDDRALWEVNNDQPLPQPAADLFWLANPYARIAAAVAAGQDTR